MKIDYEFNTIDGVYYRNEQIAQVEKGLAHGLTEDQIKIYVNPNFSELDMKIIRKAIEHNFTDEEVKLVASWSDLYFKRKEIYKAILHKICPEGVKLIAEGPFGGLEAKEIRKGFEHGLTFKQVLIYAWPDYPEYHAFAKYTDFAMKEIRKALEAGCDAEYVKECAKLPYPDMVKKLRGTEK